MCRGSLWGWIELVCVEVVYVRLCRWHVLGKVFVARHGVVCVWLNIVDIVNAIILISQMVWCTHM